MEEIQILNQEGFQIFKTLGQGAFGRVFLSYKQDIGMIAAKVMQSKVFDENEWAAAGRLQLGEPIPFIVQFKAAKKFGQYIAILMEFANLKSLDNIIKVNYDLLPGTLRAIAKQLFEGLRLIHARGLIVKIADFGLVKLQEQTKQTMLMSAKGTPLNIAPELVVGDGKADAKVDVWSMGVVLFQLAGHEYPIKATSVLDLQKLMQQRQITRPKAITDNLLWDLLMKILQFDKKDRPTAEQALQHPYFTGEQASKDISALQRQIVNAALLSQQGGDKSITLYDINPSYAVPGNEIKAAISYDPDVDLQKYYAQIQSNQQQIQQSQQVFQQQQQIVNQLQVSQINTSNIPQQQQQQQQYQQEPIQYNPPQQQRFIPVQPSLEQSISIDNQFLLQQQHQQQLIQQSQQQLQQNKISKQQQQQHLLQSQSNTKPFTDIPPPNNILPLPVIFPVPNIKHPQPMKITHSSYNILPPGKILPQNQQQNQQNQGNNQQQQQKYIQQENVSQQLQQQQQQFPQAQQTVPTEQQQNMIAQSLYLAQQHQHQPDQITNQISNQLNENQQQTIAQLQTVQQQPQQQSAVRQSQQIPSPKRRENDTRILSTPFTFQPILTRSPLIQTSSSSSSSSSSSQQNSSLIANFNTTWKLSDFKKIKKIGRGRFGSVSSYQEIRTQRNVAIKQCEYETEEEKAKFHREIDVMNDIIKIIRQSANQQQFIHVIEPLGFFVDEVEEKAYLVMELCSGGNLRNYIQNMKKSGTQIGIKKSWEFVSQIISAVNQIHVNEIIHGNLKPEKVLFTQDFNVKLADFTLPRNLQQGTTRVIQTKAADIWAIGVALYELLAQHHPFVGNYDQSTDIAKHDVVHRIVDEEALELPAHYPDSLKKLINAMLQKDPSRRISAEEILSIPEIAANLGGQ